MRKPRTDKPSGVMREPRTDKPSGVMREPRADKPSGVMREPRTDKPSDVMREPRADNSSGKGVKRGMWEPRAGTSEMVRLYIITCIFYFYFGYDIVSDKCFI